MKISLPLAFLACVALLSCVAHSKATHEEQFFEAVLQNNTGEVRSLLRGHPSINVNWKTPDSGLAALHVACSNGYVQLMELLLKHPEIDLNLAADNGFTPLMFASQAAKVDALRVLLVDARVDSNKASPDGTTAIWLAAYQGKADFVKWMVASGRRLDQKSSFSGLTILDAAKISGNKETIRVLQDMATRPKETLEGVRQELGVTSGE